MTENTQHKPVKVMFKQSEQVDSRLHHGTLEMSELYNKNDLVWIKNLAGDARYITRRNFHIVDSPSDYKPTAIVCDIDGVLNFIPKHYEGTTHRDQIMLEDGSSCQWTELNLSATAKHNLVNFNLLKHFDMCGFKLVFLTARGDTQRVQTDRWIRDGFEKVGYYPEFITFMRGWSCNDLGAPAMKAEMMQSCILPNFEVVYFIEDCPKNIALMRETCPEVPIMQIYG